VKLNWRKIQAKADVPGSCWALDIGASGLRAVAMKRPGKIIEVREVALPRTQPGPLINQELVDPLRELVGLSPPRGEIMVSTLPLHKVFMRSLEVPFTRLNLIEQVIESEAELHIPFPLDQVVIDFWPQEIIGGDKTRVMMIAVRKDFLSSHLELLSEAGLDPALIGVDILGLSQAALASGQVTEEGATMLVEIGAAHPSVVFFRDSRLVSLRAFTWGGDTLTTGIMKETGYEFPEAESLKLSSELEPEQAEVVKRSTGPALEKLESELRRTLHASAEYLTRGGVTRLLLAGRGESFPAARELIERVAGISGEPVNPGPVMKGGDKSLPGAETALGSSLLTMVPVERRVNFRRGEFTFAGSWAAVRKRLFISLGLIVGLLALLTMSLEIKIHRQEKKLGDIGRQIHSILASTFPAQAKKMTGAGEVAAMKKSLEKMKNDFEYFREFTSLSGLDIIRELSKVIPGDIKVQVVKLDVNQDRIRFRGRTDTYRNADMIKKAIQQSSLFMGEKIKESPAKTRKVGGKTVTVEFIYTIPLADRE